MTKVVVTGGRVAAAATGGRLFTGDGASDGPRDAVTFDSDITDLAPHPDGFVVSLESGRCVLTDPAGRVRERAEGVGGWRVVPHHDDYVAVGRDGGVAVLDGGLRPRWRHTGDSGWAAAVGRGVLVTASTHNTVTGRSYDTGEPLFHRDVGLPAYGCADTGTGFAVGTAEGSLLTLDDRGEVTGRLAVPAVRVLATAGPQLLAACADGSLRAHTRDLVPRWRFMAGSWVKDLAAGPTTIAVGAADHHVYVLASGGRQLGSFRTGHTVLTVDRDGHRLLAGSADGRLYFLDDVTDTPPNHRGLTHV